MTKNNLIWGVIVIVVIVLGLWYFSSMNSATPTTNAPIATTTTATTNTTTTTAAGSSTFRSIFTQSGNHECTYQQVSSGESGTSVIYISGGKMRGEFRTTGTDTEANLMIYNGGFLYSWKEGTTVGKKSSITSLADLPQAIPQDLTSGAILGTSGDNVSWDCHDWATDPSLFVIPTYVKFS